MRDSDVSLEPALLADTIATPTASAPETAAADVMDMLGREMHAGSSRLRLRPERDADLDFLRTLYASTRAEELDQVGWPPAVREQFIAQQFAAQRSQYRQHYADAAFLVIELDDVRVGRLYVHRTRSELRLMEVALLPAARGRGIGSRLMDRLVGWSDALGLPITLHVEPFNRAQRLYRRLGFDTVEVRGVYHFMRREPRLVGFT